MGELSYPSGLGIRQNEMRQLTANGGKGEVRYRPGSRGPNREPRVTRASPFSSAPAVPIALAAMSSLEGFAGHLAKRHQLLTRREPSQRQSCSPQFIATASPHTRWMLV